MFEFIVKMGLLTGGSVVAAIFIVVFLLAEPGKEISFWGLKFHKRSRSYKKKYKRLPKKIPESWIKLLRLFHDIDKKTVPESALFSEAREKMALSEIECREIISEMKSYGLLSHNTNFIYISEKALPLIRKNESNHGNV